jgi:hypothetical protein
MPYMAISRLRMVDLSFVQTDLSIIYENKNVLINLFSPNNMHLCDLCPL